MDKKLEARISRLEKILNRKNEDAIDPEGLRRGMAFEREMMALLNKYNAIIERAPDGGVWAIEDAPHGVILMTFE